MRHDRSQPAVRVMPQITLPIPGDTSKRSTQKTGRSSRCSSTTRSDARRHSPSRSTTGTRPAGREHPRAPHGSAAGTPRKRRSSVAMPLEIIARSQSCAWVLGCSASVLDAGYFEMRRPPREEGNTPLEETQHCATCKALPLWPVRRSDEVSPGRAAQSGRARQTKRVVRQGA